MDFFDRDPEGRATLIQVCTNVSDPATYRREVRSLSAAATEHCDALPLVLTFDTLPPGSPIAYGLPTNATGSILQDPWRREFPLS